MSKLNQKGSAFLILVLIFAVVLVSVGLVFYKTLTNSTKKLNKTSDTLVVALKTEYNNPFDQKTQYQNPFSQYHNPFDDLK